MQRRTEQCLNCGEPTPGRFCARCGQPNTHYHVSLGQLASELASELFQLDSRILRTLVPFLFQPGRLTNEFIAGKRQRYSAPLRLYLLTSVAYFLVLSWIGPVEVAPAANPGEVPSPVERRRMVEEQAPAFARLGSFGVRLQQRLAELVQRDEAEIVQVLGPGIAQRAPTAMFFLVPVFASILKLLFLGSRRFYLEHLVFALHYHSFCFTALLVGNVLQQSVVDFVVRHAMWIYLLVALRNVYGQSWLRTLAKTVVLLTAYGMALGVGVGVLAVLAILSE